MSKLHYNATAPTVVDGTTVEMQSDASGNLKTTVGGPAADDAAASGNPVPVGGKYNASMPTYTDGDRTQLQTTNRGAVKIQPVSGASDILGSALSTDAEARTGGAALDIAAYGLLFNGTNWSRARGNTDITVLASAARTATASSADQTNYNGRGAHIVINVTAVTSTPSVVFTVEGKDALSSAYYTILTSAAITGTGTTALTVYPGATAAANVAVSQILPRTWRVTATHGDADSITFSVGASVII